METVWIEFNGEVKTLLQWAQKLNVKKNTLSYRISAWGLEKALTEKKPTILEYNGECRTLEEWADHLNITTSGLQYRLQKWGVNEKTFKKRGLTHNNETKTFAAWSRELGLGRDTLHRRIKNGMPLEKVLTPALYKTRTSLVGKRFTWLVVVEDSGIRQCGKIIWLCICDCGNTKLVQTGNLIQKKALSCGCLRKYKSFTKSHPHLAPYFDLFV